MQIRLRRIDGRKLIREFEEGAPDWVSVHYYIRAIHTWPQIGNIVEHRSGVADEENAILLFAASAGDRAHDSKIGGTRRSSARGLYGRLCCRAFCR